MSVTRLFYRSAQTSSLVLVMATLGCATTSTKPMVPELTERQASDERRFFVAQKGFSLVPPADWDVLYNKEELYSTFHGLDASRTPRVRHFGLTKRICAKCVPTRRLLHLKKSILTTRFNRSNAGTRASSFGQRLWRRAKPYGSRVRQPTRWVRGVRRSPNRFGPRRSSTNIG